MIDTDVPCVQIFSGHDENTLWTNPVFSWTHLHVNTLQVEHPGDENSYLYCGDQKTPKIGADVAVMIIQG